MFLSLASSRVSRIGKSDNYTFNSAQQEVFLHTSEKVIKLAQQKTCHIYWCYATVWYKMSTCTYEHTILLTIEEGESTHKKIKTLYSSSLTALLVKHIKKIHPVLQWALLCWFPSLSVIILYWFCFSFALVPYMPLYCIITVKRHC